MVLKAFAHVEVLHLFGGLASTEAWFTACIARETSGIIASDEANTVSLQMSLDFCFGEWTKNRIRKLIGCFDWTDEGPFLLRLVEASATCFWGGGQAKSFRA